MNKLFSALCCLSLISGCASFSTVPITRHDSNIVSGDSNGTPRWHCRTRPFRGVPMKVKVQTHVDVYIEEQYVLWRGEKFENWRERSLPHKFYNVRTEDILTDQIVITDFKRPASGTLDLKMSFTDDQYIDKVNSSLTDTTITDSAALLGTIITKVGAGGAAYSSAGAEPSDRYQWKTRTVAYQRFDINASDYEMQVEAFVSEHLNSCNRCGVSPSYDQVGLVPIGTP